jgi:hypothetical protein
VYIRALHCIEELDSFTAFSAATAEQMKQSDNPQGLLVRKGDCVRLPAVILYPFV